MTHNQAVHRLSAPLDNETVRRLEAGDEVLVDGVVFAARDAAHLRLIQALQEGTGMPVDLRGQIIYYVGPCPAPPGRPIGSAGPTTSSRMDAYAPTLIELGLKAMIGKGPRGARVVQAMQEHGAVYLAAVGGAGALLAERIKQSQVVAYDELGPEALYRLEVENFPCIVAIDARGRSLYQNQS